MGDKIEKSVMKIASKASEKLSEKPEVEKSEIVEKSENVEIVEKTDKVDRIEVTILKSTKLVRKSIPVIDQSSHPTHHPPAHHQNAHAPTPKPSQSTQEKPIKF